MQENDSGFHNLEWPPAGATVAGPLAWLRGWAVAKPGLNFIDVRARAAGGTHLGVLGLPRPDLAAHFRDPRSWLPAGFIVGVPLADGPASVTLEAMDAAGNWHRLQTLQLTVAADGIPSPRVEGKVITRPEGSWTMRGTHLPFHGHLDEPETDAGLLTHFGWLLHESQTIRRVLATVDGLLFHHLAHGLEDASLAAKVPQLPAARQSRLTGRMDLPATVPAPASLRVYAELADSTVHLCFAQRTATATIPPGSPPTPAAAASGPPPGPALPARSSGRPRRLLFVVSTLEPEDSTLRALDLARAIAHGGRWVARIIAAEDGALRQAFEDADCPVQFVDLRGHFARQSGATGALARQVWWPHLDAVVRFDRLSDWIEPLAQERSLPVLVDPAAQVLWASPGIAWRHDPQGPLIAPIRGLASHGAGVLLRAADHLARHHPDILQQRRIHLTHLGSTDEERRFLADLQLNRPGLFTLDPAPAGLAALINPALAQPPVCALLAAMQAEVPVITTRLGPLAGGLGVDEAAVVPAGNPLALAHAMADVLHNPEAARRRAVAAQRHACDHGAFAPAFERWLGSLRAVIARPS